MIYVLPGQKVSVDFTWRNDGEIGFAPDFVLQVKGSGSGWIKGSWIETDIVAPGATSPQYTASVNIPTNWDAGAVIEAELKTKLDGYFAEERVDYWEDALQIPPIKAEWIELVSSNLVTG